MDNQLHVSVTVKWIDNEQLFPVVLFAMLYKVVLTTEMVNKTLKHNHSNGNY